MTPTNDTSQGRTHAVDIDAGLHNADDRRSRRLAVLQAAANFLGLWGQAREEVRSEHVLVLAARWLAWVEQED